MLDLSALSPEVLTARGCYSTVRAAHEDAKKELQMRCGELMSLPARILKHGTSDEPGAIDEAMNHIAELRLQLDCTEKQLQDMRSLAEQRAELKVKAWAK